MATPVVTTAGAEAPAARGPRWRRLGSSGSSRRGSRGTRRQETFAGWLFVSPALICLAVFMAAPILLAFWVSFRQWSGLAPLETSQPVGWENYRELLLDDGIERNDFAKSIRNNFYYVLGVVPMQTALALVLALIVNARLLKAKGFFRTAFYFPSVTSSIAVAFIFIFLFSPAGVVNVVLSALLPGTMELAWLNESTGVIHLVLGWFGVEQPPQFLADNEFMGLSWWDWLSGPSVALVSIMVLATWTTSGTYMLMFLGGLQNVPVELEEAAKVDGANAWQRFRNVTLPTLRPTMFLVLTLGLIGTWQVFDQVYAMTSGGPQKTTLTPAYLIYRDGFENSAMGRAAAIAFILFALILVFTALQRFVLRRKD